MNTPTTYEMKKEARHITFAPTISLTGKTLKTFVIISQKTIYDVLCDVYGLPNNEHAFIVYSASGCMNREAFIFYLDEVLIPGVNEVRNGLGLQGEWACLKLDGFSGHNGDDIDKKMQNAKIKPLWLQAHTSHLTQALDKVTFAAWKSRKASTEILIEENHQADRIIAGLRSLSEATNWVSNIHAFKRAGWTADYKAKPPRILFDERKVLGDDRAPEGEQKQLYQKEKERDKIGKRKSLPQAANSAKKSKTKNQK